MKMVRQLGNLGNLEDPETIKRLICTAKVSEGRKELLTNAYDKYVKYRGISWSKPRFTRQDKPILLPTEEELNALIDYTTVKLSTFLQLLKETAMDSGEAWKLRWIDIDTQRSTVSVTPTKNHAARILPISSNLLGRLQKLPRKNDRVFSNRHLDDFRTSYEKVRKSLSIKLDNPRIRNIAFKSFRHWKATMLYHQTKDILFVQRFLGHKRLENTLIYTHLVDFGTEDYACKAAGTIEEATALIEAGFEYVTEMDGVKLFRKRK